MYAATYGYDIWKSEPWEKNGDPGLRFKIFDINCKDNRGNEGYYDFFTVHPDFNCRKEFIVRRIKTFQDYMSAIGGTNDYSAGIGASAEGGAFGVSLKVSAKYETSGSSEQHKARRLFEEKNGEVILATATCNTNDIRLSSLVRPKFTRNFISALEMLNKSLSQSSTSQEVTMKRFIEQFGTHYMAEADFGASMVYEQRFTSRSRNASQSASRKQCLKESLNACVGGGYEGSVVHASAEVCANSAKEECSQNSFDNRWGEEIGLESTSTITIGSVLKTNEDWGTQDDFKPVPIR